MLVVSDTSPISSLTQIGRAELLRDLFGVVCVPPAVLAELQRFHDDIPDFLEVRPIADQARVKSLLTTLDLGEAEAIVLAAECQADYLLMDERRGRQVATREGVPIIGLLGVLLLAKQQHHILTVKDCVADLQSKAGFYVTEELLKRILEAARE